MLRSTGVATTLVFLLIGCGSVQTLPDEPPGSADALADGGGSPPDAADPPDASPPDAVPMPMLFNSALAFPQPNTTVAGYTAAELGTFGITAMNVSGGGSTSIIGNPDAPISSSIFVHSSPITRPTFNFATPITAVGISVYDADYGNDNPVIVRIVALDGDGAELTSHQRALAAANASGEQNAGAVFVGFSFPVAFSQVQISIDQANSTGFDNLKFR